MKNAEFIDFSKYFELSSTFQFCRVFALFWIYPYFNILILIYFHYICSIKSHILIISFKYLEFFKTL